MKIANYFRPAPPAAPPLPVEEICDRPGVRRLTGLTPAERVHYFADRFPLLRPAPIQVSVVLSNECDLACAMCPYHGREARSRHATGFFASPLRMPWETLAAIAAECGRERIGVKVGNIEEPLLHPDLPRFIRACREAGVPSFHVTTNAVTLDRPLAAALVEAGLTSLYASLDAARGETYRRIRGADLARAEANVRGLVDLRRERGARLSIRVSLVRNPGVTEAEIEEFRERWLALADGVILYNRWTSDRGSARFERISDFAAEAVAAAGERWPCLNPFQEVYLLPDGRVYYCCEAISKLAHEPVEPAGDFPRRSILEAWRGEGFRALRADLLLGRLDRRPACRDCGIWMAHVTRREREGDRIVTRNMITEIIDRAP